MWFKYRLVYKLEELNENLATVYTSIAKMMSWHSKLHSYRLHIGAACHGSQPGHSQQQGTGGQPAQIKRQNTENLRKCGEWFFLTLQWNGSTWSKYNIVHISYLPWVFSLGYWRRRPPRCQYRCTHLSQNRAGPFLWTTSLRSQTLPKSQQHTFLP